MFGDPDDLQARLGELAESMQGAQKVAFADQAIQLAVNMTVAAIGRIELTGTSDEQATQIRDVIRLIFPEAVTLGLRSPPGPELAHQAGPAQLLQRLVAGLGCRLASDPFDQFGEAVLELGCCLEAEQVAGAGRVGEAVADVAGAELAGDLRLQIGREQVARAWRPARRSRCGGRWRR